MEQWAFVQKSFGSSSATASSIHLSLVSTSASALDDGQLQAVLAAWRGFLGAGFPC